jgi:hypothetical protein
VQKLGLSRTEFLVRWVCLLRRVDAGLTQESAALPATCEKPACGRQANTCAGGREVVCVVGQDRALVAVLEMPRVVQCEERDREKEVTDTRDEEARQMRVASCEETRQMRGARDRDSAIIAGRAELEARKSALDQRRVEEELVLNLAKKCSL